MFKDRADAGKKLALYLQEYKDRDVLVLAIPRGGVEVGYYVADCLNADLSMIVSRKLPYPFNPEAGFGAIAEDGSIYLFPSAVRQVQKETIDKIIRQQEDELRNRIRVLRHNKPLPTIEDRTVILVDDGIAMGSTMRVSVMLCRNKEAKKIVVASPVAGPDVAEDMARLADEAVIIETPRFFQAVSQVYINWYDMSYEQVIEIMNKWQSRKRRHTGS